MLSNQIGGITGNVVVDVNPDEDKEIIIVDNVESDFSDIDDNLDESENEIVEDIDESTTNTQTRRFYGGGGGGSSSSGSSGSTPAPNNLPAPDESDIEFINVLRNSGKSKSSVEPPEIPN